MSEAGNSGGGSGGGEAVAVANSGGGSGGGEAGAVTNIGGGNGGGNGSGGEAVAAEAPVKGDLFRKWILDEDVRKKAQEEMDAYNWGVEKAAALERSGGEYKPLPMNHWEQVAQDPDCPMHIAEFVQCEETLTPRLMCKAILGDLCVVRSRTKKELESEKKSNWKSMGQKECEAKVNAVLEPLGGCLAFNRTNSKAIQGHKKVDERFRIVESPSKASRKEDGSLRKGRPSLYFANCVHCLDMNAMQYQMIASAYIFEVKGSSPDESYIQMEFVELVPHSCKSRPRPAEESMGGKSNTWWKGHFPVKSVFGNLLDPIVSVCKDWKLGDPEIPSKRILKHGDSDVRNFVPDSCKSGMWSLLSREEMWKARVRIFYFEACHADNDEEYTTFTRVWGFPRKAATDGVEPHLQLEKFSWLLYGHDSNLMDEDPEEVLKREPDPVENKGRQQLHGDAVLTEESSNLLEKFPEKGWMEPYSLDVAVEDYLDLLFKKTQFGQKDAYIRVHATEDELLANCLWFLMKTVHAGMEYSGHEVGTHLRGHMEFHSKHIKVIEGDVLLDMDAFQHGVPAEILRYTKAQQLQAVNMVGNRMIEFVKAFSEDPKKVAPEVLQRTKIIGNLIVEEVEKVEAKRSERPSKRRR